MQGRVDSLSLSEIAKRLGPGSGSNSVKAIEQTMAERIAGHPQASGVYRSIFEAVLLELVRAESLPEVDPEIELTINEVTVMGLSVKGLENKQIAKKIGNSSSFILQCQREIV